MDLSLSSQLRAGDRGSTYMWLNLYAVIYGKLTFCIKLHHFPCPGYDVKLIRCCPQYDVKLMWRHRGNDIVSVAAISQLIFLFGHTRLAV